MKEVNSAYKKATYNPAFIAPHSTITKIRKQPISVEREMDKETGMSASRTAT